MDRNNSVSLDHIFAAAHGAGTVSSPIYVFLVLSVHVSSFWALAATPQLHPITRPRLKHTVNHQSNTKTIIRLDASHMQGHTFLGKRHRHMYGPAQITSRLFRIAVCSGRVGTAVTSL